MQTDLDEKQNHFKDLQMQLQAKNIENLSNLKTKEKEEINRFEILIQELNQEQCETVDDIVQKIYRRFASSENNIIYEYFQYNLPYHIFISIFINTDNILTKVLSLSCLSDCIECPNFDFDTLVNDEFLQHLMELLSSTREIYSQLSDEEKSCLSEEMITKTCCLVLMNLLKKNPDNQDLFQFLLGNNILEVLFQKEISFNTLELIDQLSHFQFPDESYSQTIISFMVGNLQSLSMKNDEQLDLIDFSMQIIKDLISFNSVVISDEFLSSFDQNVLKLFISSESPLKLFKKSLELILLLPHIDEEIVQYLITSFSQQNAAPIIQLTCDIIAKFFDDLSSVLTPEFIPILISKLHQFNINVDNSIIRCIVLCVDAFNYYSDPSIFNELSNYVESKEVAPLIFQIFAKIISSDKTELKLMILENHNIYETANNFSQLEETEDNMEIIQISEEFLSLIDEETNKS